MSIPYRFNPMGKNEKKYFELIVKSAFLAKCPNVTSITDALTGANTIE